MTFLFMSGDPTTRKRERGSLNTSRAWLLPGFMIVVYRQEVFMRVENAIIEKAIITLITTQPRETFSRKLLEDYLTELYVEKYETSASVDEIEQHLLALKTVTFIRH